MDSRLRSARGRNPLRLLVAGVALACGVASAGAAEPGATAAADPSAGGVIYQAAGWKIAQGLPQGTVADIAETADGELWLATFGGLVRFDGVQFSVFDLANLVGLPSNRITALEADPEGGLWLATQTGHVVHFVAGRVVAVVAPPDRFTELVALEVARDGVPFVRTGRGEILRVEGDEMRVVMSAGPGNGRHNLRFTSDGGLWTGSQRRLLRVDTGEQFEVAGSIFDLASDGRGGLWLGLEDGLGHFARGRMERLVVDPPVDGPVTEVLPEGEGHLWIGTYDGVRELARRPDGGWRDVAAPIAAAVDVRIFHRDREGNLWVGTTGEGLIRLRPSLVRLRRPSASPMDASAVAPDGRGGLWFTASCQGLFHADSRGRTRAVPLADAGESHGCDYALAVDRDHGLWIRARDGLFVIDAPQDGEPLRARRLAVELSPEPGVLVPDPDGSLWIVSRGGRVERYSPGSGLHLAVDVGAELHSAAVAAGGTLWLGGRGQVFRLRDGNLTSFGAAARVPPGAVRALLPRGEDDLWIGTYGGGLGLLRAGYVTRISTDHGLADDSISGLIEDAAGRIWILGNSAIAVLAPGELEALPADGAGRLLPVLLGPERGVPEASFGSPSVVSDGAGGLWFTTIEGAAGIDAGSFPWNRVPPRVSIEGVRFDDKRLPFSPTIEVPASTTRVRIDYSAFARAAPERVRFRIRLAGLDRDWVDLGDRRSSSFTPAGPGRFRFEVEARNEDGIWSAQPAAVELTVLPAWWQTTLFRVAALAGGAALLLGAHRLRLRAMRRRNRALLREIEERQQAESVAARLRRELEHVARIATAGELATSLAHEVNQPLAAIVSNAQAGQRFLHLGETGRAELGEILGDIARQGQRASEVIHRLRTFLGKEAPHRDALDLNQVVREVLPLLRREIEERGIEVVLDFGVDLPRVTGDRVQLQQVVVNLMQNACDALRSSPARRRVDLRTRGDGEWVELTIEDTGAGVPPSIAATIFEPFVSTKADGMGMGLSICRSLVESHAGTLTLESPPAGGARLRLRLPAEQSAAAAS